jgi:hypothetical protein
VTIIVNCSATLNPEYANTKLEAIYLHAYLIDITNVGSFR